MKRSTSHSLKFANVGKIQRLHDFIDEYRRVAQIIVDHIWINGYEWHYEKEVDDAVQVYAGKFSVAEERYEIPSYIDYNAFDLETTLSGRALSSLVTQISGLLRSCTEKQRKRIWSRDFQIRTQGFASPKLLKKIKKNVPGKPRTNNLNLEFSSKCCDWEDSEGIFLGFLRLKSLGEVFEEIILPIKQHKHGEKFKDWKRAAGFLVTKDCVNLRWEKEAPAKKSEGRVVGADQGKLTCLTLSDGQITSVNAHGYDVAKVIDVMARKKKGSRAFHKCQDHRENLINWSVNRLNFSGIKEIRLEEVVNINYGRKAPRKLVHWTNTIIRDKVEDRCEREGVLFTQQSSTYRSQKCSNCDWVQKANRKGKIFCCKQCCFEVDADFNAACNHEQDLPDVPAALRGQKLNRDGFFWKPAGFFLLNGEEIRVPLDTSTQTKSIT